jgi:hypothetical protein
VYSMRWAKGLFALAPTSSPSRNSPVGRSVSGIGTGYHAALRFSTEPSTRSALGKTGRHLFDPSLTGCDPKRALAKLRV